MHLDFRPNLGNVDRGIRLVIGLLLLTVPTLLRTSAVWSWVLYGLAAFDIAQALVGY